MNWEIDNKQNNFFQLINLDCYCNCFQSVAFVEIFLSDLVMLFHPGTQVFLVFPVTIYPNFPSPHLSCPLSALLIHNISCPTLVLYGIRVPIIGPFHAWKPTIPYAIKNQRGANKMRARPRHSSTNESGPGWLLWLIFMIIKC